MSTPSLYAQLGGEPVLRAILTDFYDHVFDDIMIGYLFARQAKERLIEREFEFTARMLGADVKYNGKGMRAAHAKHPIMRGHFQRRNVLLAQAIDRHDVPEPVRTAWLAHAEALRTAIIGKPAAQRNDCAHDLATARDGRETS